MCIRDRSSSHTAGAVRIGYISRQLLGEPVKDATLGLYGSFWLAGSGHGTPLALIAGLCGMHPVSYTPLDVYQRQEIGYSIS